MERLFVGIDGGQSSTTVLIADEHGRVIGSATGGPCNHVSGSEAAAKFLAVIGACLADACRSALLNPSTVSFEAACCGMSGGADDKRELLERLIRTHRLILLNDGEIALSGALAGKPGIIVIAGTGSISFGRNRAGQSMRCGGWGYVFGDEGGAFDIARQALRAALRFEEGWGTPTVLLPALLASTGAHNANDVLHLFYTPDWPRSRIATLAVLVDSVANDGDLIARSILEQAGQNLASLAASIRATIFPEESNLQVAYVGGAFRSRILLERFQLLVELGNGSRCVPPALVPAGGALLQALSAVGLSITLSDVPSQE